MAGNGKYQHKRNRGSMFENDRKTEEKHPDFRGDIDIEGKVYWISGWKAMTANGKKRISLSVQAQEERHPEQQHDEDGEGWGGALPRQPQPRPQPRRQDPKW